MNNRFLNQSLDHLGRVARQLAIHLPSGKSWRNRSGFGLNEIIGIAITVTVAALVIAPGIRTFAGSVLTNMNTWFTSIAGDLFATT